MHLSNLRFPARRERFNRPAIWPVLCILSLPLIGLIGCANGKPSMAPVSAFFSGLSGTETPTPTATPTSTPTTVATPEAAGTTGRVSRRAATRAAASKAAANASAQAPTASKQVEGTKTTGADVSLEPAPGATAAVTLATPSPAAAVPRGAVAAGTPTLSSSGVGSSAAPGDADPAKAAKMIGDVDRIETRSRSQKSERRRFSTRHSRAETVAGSEDGAH